jgi:hypothetical protein
MYLIITTSQGLLGSLRSFRFGPSAIPWYAYSLFLATKDLACARRTNKSKTEGIYGILWE